MILPDEDSNNLFTMMLLLFVDVTISLVDEQTLVQSDSGIEIPHMLDVSCSMRLE